MCIASIISHVAHKLCVRRGSEQFRPFAIFPLDDLPLREPLDPTESQNERHLPLVPPMTRVPPHQVHRPLPRPLLSNRPVCRLPLVRSLGLREYSGPGTALLLGAILLLPSHRPRGSLSPLLCHPLPPRLVPLDRLPETGLEDQS